MTKTALTLIALIALSGCAKPGCGYSGRLEAASERASLGQYEAKQAEKEYRVSCGMKPRRSLNRNAPGVVCVNINGRVICQAR